MLSLMKEPGHTYTDRNLNTFQTTQKKSFRNGRSSVPVIENPPSPLPLHFEYRKREQLRMSVENVAIADRINHSKSVY